MRGIKTRKTVVPFLLGINIGVFILQKLLGNWFTNAFAISSTTFLAEPWTIITSMFLHGSLFHLFFNMYALFLFGSLVEQKIGTKRFLFLYFASGILAGIGFSVYRTIIGDPSSAIGASGAVMGVLGVTIILLPNLPIMLWFIPMTMRTAGIVFVAMDLAGLFGFPILGGVANSAHLFGLAFGLVYGLSLLKKRKSFETKFVDKPLNHHSGSIELSDKDVDEYLKNGRI